MRGPVGQQDALESMLVTLNGRANLGGQIKTGSIYETKMSFPGPDDPYAEVSKTDKPGTHC